jgi:predicted Zn-dependent protease
VRRVGNQLGDVSDRALPYEFVILNSSVPNAWALPGGKIAVNRGLLLELQSEAELAAVLGHEIVHAAARHGAQAMQRGLLLQGAVMIAAVAARDRDYSSAVVGAAGLGAQLINMRNGREAELEADAYGMRYMSRAGYDPRAAVELQQTFVRLSEGRDSGGWFAGLFASHPPSAERVARNQATAATLPATGTLGREEYMAATANLRRDAPGYESLAAATAALGDRDLALARREAETARERITDEALVHGVFGDIELADDRPDRALPRYDQALALNDRFFYFQLKKGDSHLALDQISQADAAYQASIALLPTAGAYLGLGRVAERRGNIALALEHYGRAAESTGQTGVAARAATVRLDLPQNPERYLAVASGLDANGQLLIEIRNQTDAEVAGIEVGVSFVDGGQARLVRRALDGTLAAGGTRRYATGLGPFASSADYDVAIETARVVASQ